MPVDGQWLERARQIVGPEGLLLAASEMEPYAHDEYAVDSYARVPAAVLKPADEQQVADLVRLCAETGVALTARGGGTGLAAACVPCAGGVVLSFERLDRVIEADPANLCLTVQAGVTLGQIYEAADAIGLFFPPHPGDEGAMAGGMVATNAGGARAVKYGTIKRFLLGLQVVLGTGEVVELGGKFIKSSCGYNLLDLMVGSEGTLGVITRVTLALLPRPGSFQTLLAPFSTVTAAISSVPAILQQGFVPLAVEFVEHEAVRASERLLNKAWPARGGTASLMVVLDGAEEALVMSQAERIGEILERQGALDVFLADQKARQQEILELRSMIYEALRPGTAELFDVCVPRGEISGHVEHVHALGERLGVDLPTYGHAADGNVHTNFMRLRLRDGQLGEEVPGWQALHAEVRREILEDAIRRRGIISAEHGIGLAKRDYLTRNLGETSVAVMRSLKAALDPHGILNPGKIFAP
jgi:glycolate oxidase